MKFENETSDTAVEFAFHKNIKNVAGGRERGSPGKNCIKYILKLERTL